MTALVHPVHLHVYFYVQEHLQRSCQTLAVHQPIPSFFTVMYQIISYPDKPPTIPCVVCPQILDSLVSKCATYVSHGSCKPPKTHDTHPLQVYYRHVISKLKPLIVG